MSLSANHIIKLQQDVKTFVEIQVIQMETVMAFLIRITQQLEMAMELGE